MDTLNFGYYSCFFAGHLQFVVASIQHGDGDSVSNASLRPTVRQTFQRLAVKLDNEPQWIDRLDQVDTEPQIN